MTSARLAFVLACAWVAGARASAAQTAPPLTALQATFDRGVEAERSGRHAEACALFEEVLRHHDEPLVRVNLALAYRAVGRYVDAVAQLRRYLAAPLPGERPEHLARMREAVAEMERTLARVRVRVTPATARLTVDRRAAAPGELALDPGAHTLELEADGHQSLRRELRLEPGLSLELDLALEPVVTTGRVVVVPTPERATVTVDGRARGTGRLDLTLDAGAHTLEVSAPAHTPFRRGVTVTAGGFVHIDATLVPSRPRPAWLLPVVIAGSVLLVGGAIAVAVVATRPDEPTLPLTPTTRVPLGP